MRAHPTRVSDQRVLPSGEPGSRAKAPVVLWPSAVLPQEPPASATAARKPANYLTAEQAYSLVSSLPYEDAALIADGKMPHDPSWGERPVTAQMVRAARELLSTKGNPVEINGRMDGPMVRVIEDKAQDARTAAVLALLASLPPLPAQRRTTPAGGEEAEGA